MYVNVSIYTWRRISACEIQICHSALCPQLMDDLVAVLLYTFAHDKCLT